ncbi:MAG: bifunctional phosphopantothenoylcysteine decarboxylase/phosphopantothenate--cysteine ligase CoaBC [Bacteroidetes bacterium]|nr:MAG: bifunctional phosphopantothenoylcysteine decarboxylase/phosphopantothenate--cysteine ligase CoaBC [Bacteroidota bacterium]
MLNRKKILLGVTGGIAAYKAASLIRLLIKNGAEVKVVCTPNALNFVTPLTLSTLSKNAIYSHFFVQETGEWVNHVELGKWADAIIIAPATANTMAKMADGLCDNLLLATYLSADCPVFFAPAMDLDMYLHPASKKNIITLKSFENIELPAGTGELASGLIGKGRMCEPETILEIVSDYFSKSISLEGKTILVNAGPTYEKLDPVRFIGNYSSGKMGKAIANELCNRGAKVILVLGPVKSDGLDTRVELIKIESAQDMYEACSKAFTQCDAAILSAAVADYRPAVRADQKIKKKADNYNLELIKTVDVLKSLGTMKTPNQVLIGFALETENEFNNAQSKLKKKNLDFIVLNSMNDKGAGFGKDTNKITIIEKNGKSHTFDTKPKKDVAKDIITVLESHL